MLVWRRGVAPLLCALQFRKLINTSNKIDIHVIITFVIYDEAAKFDEVNGGDARNRAAEKRSG